MNNPNRPAIRQPYGYDEKAASDDTGLTCSDPSLTVQSLAEDADINIIMKRFGIGAKIPENHRLPQYGDYTNITDFASAQRAILQAQANFMEVPAEIRQLFHNDPQQFLEFANNPENYDDLVNLGLAKERTPEPEPAPTPNATPEPTPSTTAPQQGTQATTTPPAAPAK